MQFMNLVTSVLPYKGSGSVSRLGTSLRLGIPKCLLRHRRVRTMHRWGQEVWSEPPRFRILPSGFGIARGRTRHPHAVILKEWSAFGSLGAVLGARILAVLDAH